MGAGRPVSIVEVEARACPLRQLRRCFIATAQAACHAPASEAVTDVTDYFSSNPLFFGHRVIDVQSVKTSAAHDHLVQKIVLTAIVDQAHNSNKRPLLRGPTDKPPFGGLTLSDRFHADAHPPEK
jgi:hypothetical protein